MLVGTYYKKPIKFPKRAIRISKLKINSFYKYPSKNQCQLLVSKIIYTILST